MNFEFAPEVAQVLQFISILVAGALSLIGALKDFGTSTYFGYPRKNIVLALAGGALCLSIAAFTVNFLIQRGKIEKLEYEAQILAHDFSSYEFSITLEFDLERFPELAGYFDFINKFFDSYSPNSADFVVKSALDITTGDDTVTRGDWISAISPYLIDRHVTSGRSSSERAAYPENQDLALWVRGMCKRTFVVSVWLPKYETWKKGRTDIDICKAGERVRFEYDDFAWSGGKHLTVRAYGIPLNDLFANEIFLSVGNSRSLLDMNGAVVVGQILNHTGIVPPDASIKRVHVSKADGTGAVLGFFNDYIYFEDKESITPGFIWQLPCNNEARNLGALSIKLNVEAIDSQKCNNWRALSYFLGGSQNLTVKMSEFDDWHVVDWSREYDLE